MRATLARSRAWSFAALSLLLALQAALLAAFPRPRGYVNDFAGSLDSASTSMLEAELRGIERQTTAEIVLVTIPSLDGMTIEQYANGLFEEWKIGKRGKDNGVLVLIAPVERRVRIEVGYGLEPVLPDGLAGEIIRTVFVPAFRSGDFAQGIVSGTGRVAEVVTGGHALTPEERRSLSGRSATAGQPPWIVIVAFFSIFIGTGAFVLGLGLGSGTIALVVWGAIFGGIALLLLMTAPAPDSARWTLQALGLGLLVWGYVKGRALPAGAALGRWTGVRGAPGRWTTDTSPATSSSADSGSSDIDFGGGSSGGGGASGSW